MLVAFTGPSSARASREVAVAYGHRWGAALSRSSIQRQCFATEPFARGVCRKSWGIRTSPPPGAYGASQSRA
jgi:hypothetical protein